MQKNERVQLFDNKNTNTDMIVWVNIFMCGFYIVQFVEML